MKTKSIWCIALVLSLLSVSVTSFAEDRLVSVKLESQIAKQTLNFEVWLPSGYGEDKEEKYPVFYTTAGGSRTNILRAQLDWLSHVSMGPMPEVVLVNLPFVMPKGQMFDKDSAASGKLYEINQQVITQEVLPYIEQNFPVLPFNIIEGYSTNANLVLHLFREKPQSFNAYIVQDPALVLDKTNLVKSFEQYPLTAEYKHRFLYLSFGAFEQNFELYQRLSQDIIANKNKHMVTLFKDLSAHNFLSVAVNGLTDAIEAIFSDRSPKINQFSESGIEGVDAYFSLLKDKYGFEMDSSNAIIDLSYHYLAKGLTQKAIETIRELTQRQPSNVFLMSRQAMIEHGAGNTTASLNSWKNALKLAKEQNNQEATQFISNKLNQFK